MTIRDELDDDEIFSGSSAVEHITTTQGNNYSVLGAAFRASNPDTDQVYLDEPQGYIQAQADGITLICPLNLPDNATITEVLVYGTAAGETWTLRNVRILDGVATDMASAAINTADNSITNPKIDNSTKAYMITTSSIDTNDVIAGVLIKYKFAG